MTQPRVMILAPHTDDGELACGGTMARFIEEGHEVYYVAFSTCETAVPAGLPSNTLDVEMREAMSVLGVHPDRIITFAYEARRFPDRRQDILQNLHDLNARLQPDMVFSPSLRDLHQDHHAVAAEASRAFKRRTLYGYEQPWNNVTFDTNAFIRLERRHVQKKVDALDRYESQKFRTYLTPDFIWSWARTRGTQIECEFAESFEVVRRII